MHISKQSHENKPTELAEGLGMSTAELDELGIILEIIIHNLPEEFSTYHVINSINDYADTHGLTSEEVCIISFQIATFLSS